MRFGELASGRSELITDCFTAISRGIYTVVFQDKRILTRAFSSRFFGVLSQSSERFLVGLERSIPAGAVENLEISRRRPGHERPALRFPGKVLDLRLGWRRRCFPIDDDGMHPVAGTEVTQAVHGAGDDFIGHLLPLHPGEQDRRPVGRGIQPGYGGDGFIGADLVMYRSLC